MSKIAARSLKQNPCVDHVFSLSLNDYSPARQTSDGEFTRRDEGVKKGRRPKGVAPMSMMAVLYRLGEGPGDDILLLFAGQGVESHCITGDANRQVRVIIRVFDGVH